MSSSFRGTGVALITPFDENGKVDFEALERVVDHVSKGVDFLVVNGTTGESATTSKEERKEILKHVREFNKKKLPIVYGLGGNDTSYVLRDLEEIDLTGVDALLSVTPYYNKPSDEGIFQHFKNLSEKSPVPIILYNVPGRTGCNASSNVTLRLAELDNIVGVKEASGDMSQAVEIAREQKPDFTLLSGDDMLTIPLISVGAQGVISVLANAFPVTFSNMVRNALDNKFDEARKELYKFSELNPCMYEESNPVGVKQVLETLGICRSDVRLPLLNATSGLKERIERIIREKDIR